MLVVYALATARHRGLSTTVLLLSGVTLNAFFSALILFVQYLSNFADTYRALRWLMGNLDVAGYAPLLAALPFIVASLAAFAWLARPLNLLSLGDEAATSRGLDTRRAQRIAFFSGSVATGAAVSVGGPIGFVGIIVPHLVRLVVGADHRLVLPASTFFGAAFLVGCDTVARTVMAPLELPVGIITAVIGGPFFLWLLLRQTMMRLARVVRLAARGAWGLRLAAWGSAAIVLSASQQPSPPSRIISLIPSVTEMLFAMGAGDQVVGVSSFDTYPPEAAKKARVGALLNPDFERILSLKPDLVVVYVSQTDLIGRSAARGRSDLRLSAHGARRCRHDHRVTRRTRWPTTGSVAARSRHQTPASTRSASRSRDGRGRVWRSSSDGKPERCATSSSARAWDSCTTSSKRPAVRMRSPM